MIYEDHFEYILNIDSDKEITNFTTNEFIEEDYEQILILSDEILETNYNKKIKIIKIMISYLTKDNFNNLEKLIFYTIFNHNSSRLCDRTKLFNTYIIINIICEFFQIKFTNKIKKILFPKVPLNYKDKKYKFMYNEIIKNYNFDIFSSKVECININNNRKLSDFIIYYVNGYILLFKSYFINDEKIKEIINYSNKNDLCKLHLNIKMFSYYKNHLSKICFCNNKKIKIISQFLTQKIKLLLVLFDFITKSYTINDFNHIETFIQKFDFLVLVLIKIIIIIFNEENKYIYKIFFKFLNNTNALFIFKHELFYFVLHYNFNKILTPIKFKSVDKFIYILYKYLKSIEQ